MAGPMGPSSFGFELWHTVQVVLKSTCPFWVSTFTSSLFLFFGGQPKRKRKRRGTSTALDFFFNVHPPQKSPPLMGGEREKLITLLRLQLMNKVQLLKQLHR